MSETDLIDRLAELAGIQPFYFDAWGDRVEVASHTKAALLTAMGFDVGSEAAAAEALAHWEKRPWQRTLSPVHVFDQNQPDKRTPLALPAGSGVIGWSLKREDGQEESGTADFSHLDWIDGGEVDGQTIERRALGLPGELPLGYHQLVLSLPDGGTAASRIIVCPPSCLTVEEAVPGGRAWGFTTQVYSLRSDDNWGMGDFSDLAAFCEGAASLGAQTVGVNPLHALYANEPRHISPYDPSSRAFLNVAYINPQRLPEFAACKAAQKLTASKGFKDRLKAARGAEVVDYGAAGQLKREVLELLFQHFEAEEAGAATSRAAAFDAFVADMGEPLRTQCLFDALHEELYRVKGGPFCWWDWPEGLQSASGSDVAAFAAAHEDRIRFFAWLQWLADIQLGEVATRARAAGMPLGLYRDIAVAVNPAGAEAWSGGDRLVRGAAVGAPPDIFSPRGQNWGLKPFNPVGLVDSAYEPYIAAVRANMRHAGAVRIDHAMWLFRLYWVPDGMSPAEGAYVHYPFADLLRIVALESRRQNCVVIAEDLGTVPEGFSPALQAAGVLSYRVQWFERNYDGDGGFFAPKDWPAQAMACISTHDLPSLAGFWSGNDIDWRQKLNLFKDDGQAAREHEMRADDKRRLVDALVAAGALAESDREAALGKEATLELRFALHRFIALTPCRMVVAQIEDALGEVEQVNLPGTIDQHPNWRQRLAVPVRDIFVRDDVKALAAAIRESVTG
jgi:4-alpha-glucanotransferase